MNYGNSVKAWSAGLIFSVASSLVCAGPIAEMTLDFQDGENNGFPEDFRNVTIKNGGVDKDVSAGMFRFVVNAPVFYGDSPFDLSEGDVLDAFCVDINTNLAYGPTGYSLVHATEYFGDSMTVKRIGQLYSGYGESINGADQSAAFQLALWEIINETGDDFSLLFDENNGSFSSTESGNARETANEWLDSLEEFQNNFNLFVLESDRVE